MAVLCLGGVPVARLWGAPASHALAGPSSAWGPSGLLWSPGLFCAAVLSFLVRVGSEARACVRLQPFRAPRLLRGTRGSLQAASAAGCSAGLSGHLGRRRRAWRSDPLGCALSAALRFPPWVMPFAVRFCVPISARAPLSSKAAPNRPRGSFFAQSAGSHGVCLSRAVLPLRMTALSPPRRCSGSSASTANLIKPESAASALHASTPSVLCAVAADPQCVCRPAGKSEALPEAGRRMLGQAPQTPPLQAVTAGVTIPPLQAVDVASPCGPASMMPRPTTTSTTLTAPRCSCLVTPLLRQCCCLACRQPTSCSSRSRVGSPWTSSPVIQQDYAVAVEEAAPFDLELDDLGLSLSGCGLEHGWTCMSPGLRVSPARPP